MTIGNYFFTDHQKAMPTPIKTKITIVSSIVITVLLCITCKGCDKIKPKEKICLSQNQQKSALDL